jgi:hypothetical protein
MDDQQVLSVVDEMVDVEVEAVMIEIGVDGKFFLFFFLF